MIALGIATASVIMFVGTGGTLMPQIARAWFWGGSAPDMLLINAVLLNIALLLFGWRRYRDLHAEVEVRRRAEERARELAERDPLTGCLNRRSGPPAMENLRRSVAETQREIAVMMIDLDNFKQINDLNGHQMGDTVLSTVARRIADVLPDEAILARIGGDEFACALPFDYHAREDVDDIVDLVIRTVSAPIEANRLTVEATVSIGVAQSGRAYEPQQVADAEALIHRADIAMYHAKKRGRNRYYWFEPQMEDELRFRNELEAGIRQGIAADEFVPFYEQQIDLETGKLSGFEMLARWKSPRYGIVSPEIFIPIAEEIDLISELSERLIRQALEDAKDWDPGLTLSVNISPVQLRDPWFAQKLLHLLVESGFPPARLEIEITESCLHENIGAVRSIVSSLKNQGIRISLDDFGTGYSSLSQLRSLPFDRLKIDRSFVAEMAAGGEGRTLVEAIISLGKGLSLPVTAEGIESDEVLGQLKGMGEMKGQGYLYGLPEDASTTRDRLARLGMLKDTSVSVSAEAVQALHPQRRAS
ncbi:putative bifunctional diguanylate cyclase/phosphodiesterase [Aurantiacibacter zhengii]|uniref:EAL domain-containing protein n=1 Tax=Aurantiacibacter zhengii TaxID=2307003 RepID=A0A418NQ23_9SPHN|nr:EAL domain-containing protein [Aurantiacibacter zhengii]RIV84641.1 EAL domain-containing protein [Aurantiacibacter zhengii]